MYISRLNLTAMLLALLGLAAPASASASFDATLIWLAAGEHEAPCDAGLRCATRLDCDPDTLRCLVPAQLELTMLDVAGCHPDWEIRFHAANRGEIALHEELLLQVTVGTAFYPFPCEPSESDDSSECDWGTSLAVPPRVTPVSVELALEAASAEEVALPFFTQVQPYTVAAGIAVEVSASTEVAPIREHWSISTDDLDPEQGSDVCF